MVENGSGVSFDRFLGRPEADLKGGSGGAEPPQLRPLSGSLSELASWNLYPDLVFD